MGESSGPVQWFSPVIVYCHFSLIASTSPRFTIVSTSPRFTILHTLKMLLSNCIRFSFPFPMVFASAAAPRLRVLQLPLLDLHPFQLLHAPRVNLFAIIPRSTKYAVQSTQYNKYEGCTCVTSLRSPAPEHPTSVTHAHTHTCLSQ